MRQAGRRFVARLAHLAATPSRRLSMKVALAIVGVAALVLVSAGSVSVWLFRDAQLRSLTALHVLEASMAADRIERFIDDLDRRMAELVALPWSSTSDDDRRIDTLRTLRALAPVHTLRLIDPQGREQVRVARLGADIAGSGADFSGNADYLAAARTGRHTGRVYFQDGSEPYVTLALRGPSTRQGGVVADVNLKLIWDIVAATRIGQAGRMLLVDGDGRLISHTDIGQALRRADVTQLPQVRAALTPSLAAREERLVPGLNLDGLPILSAHARLTSLGWSVVTELPRAEVMVPIASIVQLAGLALVGGFAAAVLCGIVVARSVVRPIEVLTAVATRIGSRSLDHRIAINGSDEFAELGSRFNEMAARLQAERATL